MAVDKSTPILVVDDYKTMVRIVRNLLNQLGFANVDDASDGASALAKLRAKRFGLVISDWAMEPMSGLELLQAMRADPDLTAELEDARLEVAIAKSAAVLVAGGGQVVERVAARELDRLQRHLGGSAADDERISRRRARATAAA